MKDYMASGSFARGKEEKAATASMASVGNINQSVDVLLKTSSLFDPFPPEMGTDTAFLDRIRCYLPGWEIPKFRPEHFTNDYGFISDYLAEFIRELRKEQYGDSLDHYFRVGKNLNQRDTISGTMIKVDELANMLQVCLDSGAKKVLIPSTSFVDFASVPADLMSAFQLIPYQSAEDAVFKALGAE